jgi:hypothetical protein
MVTVWCGDCYAEGRHHPSKLGQLLCAKRNGSVVWHVQDRRGSTHRLPDGTRGPVFETQAIGSGEPAGAIPMTLPAWCERHGEGAVSLHDVLAGSATIVLTLS